MIDRLERSLTRREAVVVVALLTAALHWWLAGSLSPIPWVYDEAAYLLQAKIFATGHWTAAGRPLPEFFEQLHVFVTPKLAPKYPPGHALLLVPGVWLGHPWLMPLLFNGLTAALVFGFARSLLGVWPGLLTWVIWVTAPAELYLRPSYMSQVSSTLIWLTAWWLLERWRQGGQRRDLVMLAIAAGLAVIVRPITAFAFLIPAGLVVLRGVMARRQWPVLGAACVAALPVLGIAVWWSIASGGRPYPTPYSEYSRVYTPWNMPGFAVDSTPPERAEIPAVRRFREEWRPIHERHTLERLPAIAAERLAGIGVTFFGDGGFPGVRTPVRWILVLAFVAGLIGLPRPIGLALLSGGVLFVSMLWLASRPLWTIYYFEAFPALAAATAWGAWRLARRAAGLLGRPSPAALVLGGLALAVPGTVDRLIRARQQQIDLRETATMLATRIDSIEGQAVVFVAPGPAHRPYESYVVNEPDLGTTRVWIAHDRGADNVRLMAIAPGRLGYRFDPGTGGLTRLDLP
ncbi:MAG: hypothetical protein FJ206_08320 [Gemmatimonadetes bacterium]|nr:hypothetical protein [Gemmatimonadota bacterium]